MQAAWTKKIGENNVQLCFRLPRKPPGPKQRRLSYPFCSEKKCVPFTKHFTNQICEHVFFRLYQNLQELKINLQICKYFKSTKIANHAGALPKDLNQDLQVPPLLLLQHLVIILSFLEATPPRHCEFSFLLLNSSGNVKV